MSFTAQEVIWLRDVLNELGFPSPKRPSSAATTRVQYVFQEMKGITPIGNTSECGKVS